MPLSPKGAAVGRVTEVDRRCPLTAIQYGSACGEWLGAWPQGLPHPALSGRDMSAFKYSQVLLQCHYEYYSISYACFFFVMACSHSLTVVSAA
jgi:hypothetical protein